MSQLHSNIYYDLGFKVFTSIDTELVSYNMFFVFQHSNKGYRGIWK